MHINAIVSMFKKDYYGLVLVNDDAQSKNDIRNSSVYKGRWLIYGLEYRPI